MCPSHEYDKDVSDPQWIPVCGPLVISFIQCFSKYFLYARHWAGCQDKQ